VLYTVKSKSSLNELKEVLVARNFKPTMKVETLLEVEVSEQEKDEFYLIIAFAISYNAFKKIILEELKRLKIEEDLGDRFFYEACHYFQNSKYWIGLSKVWVVDSLNTRNTIHADTFPTFNMKGFKQEIKDYVEKMLDHHQAHEDMGTTHLSEVIEPVSMEEMFDRMKERVKESGLNLSNFKELHVMENGEGFMVRDKEGNELDEEFFLVNVGIMLHISLGAENESVAIHDAMTLMTLCHIFEPEKVVLHHGLSDVAERAFNQNKELMTQHTDKSISFVSCEGCEKCDNAR